MSFGIGIGDVLKILELTKNLRKIFVEAPRQFLNISQEVRTLSIVLDDIEVHISGSVLAETRQKDLEHITSTCQDVLQDLQTTLAKYHELQDSGGRWSKKTRRVWKRLTVEPQDIREVRHRLTSTTSLLSTFLGSMTSSISLEIKEGVDRLNRDHDREARLEVLNWLTPIDYTSRQADLFRTNQTGTGEWFLNSMEYFSWKQAPGATLFCPGIPGAGKTILSSSIIEDLVTQYQRDQDIGISYIFCNYRQSEEQTVDHILFSVLKQLIQVLSPIPAAVLTLYDRYSHNEKRPPLDEVCDTLRMVLDNFSRVFIVIDALDECRNHHRKDLLRYFSRLQSNRKTNLLATSRFIPDVAEWFKDGRSLEIRASSEDIEKYLDSQFAKLPSVIRESLSLQEEIKYRITRAVDGMFLLAKLYVDSLDDKITRKAVRLALRAFDKRSPESSEEGKRQVLDAAYQRSMERISNQSPGLAKFALATLSWIVFARRALTWSELQHALAVEHGEASLDSENLPRIEDIVSVCAGLVTTDTESDEIRLIHFTIQEYLEEHKRKWFPGAESSILTTCLTYLSFDAFQAGPCTTERALRQRLRSYPFYSYAARLWGYHTEESPRDSELVIGFLLNTPKAAASSQVITIYRIEPEYCFPFTTMKALHLAAYFKKLHALSYILENDTTHTIEVRDDGDKTPLIWAATNGALDSIDLLLKSGANIESKDKHGQTALSAAVSEARCDPIRLLLDRGADIESRNHLGRTPLMVAICNGNEDITQLLLDRGANLNSSDPYGFTSLMMAGLYCSFKYFSDTITQMLSTRYDLDPQLTDNLGRSALSYAAISGNESMVTLLVANERAKLNQQDRFGATPLSMAVRRGHMELVETFLGNKDTQLDTQDCFGRSPLWYAKTLGYENISQLLVQESISRGVVLREGETHVTTALTATTTGRVYCDICVLNSSGDQEYLHCRACNGGDFDICLHCFQLGARCLDDTHDLERVIPGDM